MELSNELRLYIESHPDGLKLREIPDELLFEMLEKATKCEVEKNGSVVKGTDAFQKYFNLDMSYTTAYQEPKLRGYEKVWKKKEPEPMQITIDTIKDAIPVKFYVRKDIYNKWLDFLDNISEDDFIETTCNIVKKQLQNAYNSRAIDEGGCYYDWCEFNCIAPILDDYVSASLILFMNMFNSKMLNINYNADHIIESKE